MTIRVRRNLPVICLTIVLVTLLGASSGAFAATCNTAADCADDGVACTVAQCQNHICVHLPDNSLCPGDGLWCNGTDTCDSVAGCVAGASPCAGQLCDEVADACFDCAQGGPTTKNALWFDGSNDYVTAGSPAALQMTETFTVEAWILPTNNTYGVIVSKENEWEIARFPDGTIRWAVNNNVPGWTWTSTGATAPLNTWTHVAWTFDYTTTQKTNVYVNGALVQSMFEVGPIRDTAAPGDEFRIGGRLSAANPFAGAIDEVRIWNVARTAAQVQGSMTSVLTGAESGLKGYWRFEEGTGATTADLASGSTGTLSGAAWTTVSCADTAFCNGVESCGANHLCTASNVPCAGQLCNEANHQCYGCAVGGPATRNGLKFDGTGDGVAAGASSALQMTTAFTLEAWILPTTDVEAGAGGIIAGKDGEFLFARNTNGTLKWALNNTSPGFVFVNTTAVAPLESWSHVAMTYDGANVRTYLNGALAATQAATGAIRAAAAPTNLFRIGNRYGIVNATSFFAGTIDDVAVWNVALAAATIAAHASAGAITPVSQPNLKGYWRFDEGSGATTADAALGNTAAIRGASWVVDGCLDAVGCTVDACSVSTHTCQHTCNNASCDDGNACTTDTCDAVAGCLHAPISCNDGNACTVDACNPATGCGYSPLSCDDGNACTNDTCNAAGGCAHTTVSCNDSNACTTDTCNPATGCGHAAVSCDDAVACTADTCNPATGCQHAGNNAACNDGVACTHDICDPAADGGCAHVADNALCDDGVGCNGAETCSPTGGCRPGVPGCDDGDVCTTDVCDVTHDTCSHTVDNSRCDDGIACTVDVCDAHSDGGCDHRLDNAACDDGNTDTADVCTPEKGCVHTPLPDDGNACTVDTCDPATGVCTHTPVVCSDGDVCSNNTCDPATGCPPPGAGQCVDDGLFCNGQEECDPEQGCRHTGNPCLPDWQCDEDTRSCLSEFWSSFWQVRSPDATCTMIMLPTTLQPTIDDTDWALEARCHDSVIGYGQLTELTHVQTSAFEWPAPAIHPGMTGMTIYRVVGTVVSPTNAARYVSGLIAEYTIEGDAEPHRELAVLEEADSLSAALDLANRSTAESLPSNAAAATSCGLLFPTPGTIADCDTKTASCRKVVYAGYAVAASACVARQWSANLACLATCEEPPWLQCVATCGVPQFLAAICWAGVDVALNQGLQACDECGKACHCDYFLDQCPVNAPVGFHVTGLCPGDHVEMSGNCHRGNAQHDFDQDIEQGGSFVGHDIIELQCPVGTEWEVHSGPVLSHTHPQQEPRDCTPQGTSSGTVAVGSSNIPLFFCGDPNSVNSGTCDAPQVPRTIRGLVSSDVPIPGGIFVHLAANTGQNNPEVNLYRNADPTGNPAFEFPPMPDDTYWTLAVGFNNATQNADNECFFQGSGQGAISGRLEGADVNALIHCRGKSGFPVLVSVHNGTRSSFNYLTLFFNPDNGPTAGESYVYQDQIVRFGPIPDGTQYTLHVNQPTFNTAMKCQFENGQEDVHGQIHGAQAEHTILCTCTDSATDDCPPNPGDEPFDQQIDQLNQAFPPCSFCDNSCHQLCDPLGPPGNCNLHPCPCPPDSHPGSVCDCCDVNAPGCPITCYGSLSGAVSPSTVLSINGPRFGDSPGNMPMADQSLVSRVDAHDPDGIGAFFWFVDDEMADQLILRTAATQASSGDRAIDTTQLSEGVHRLTVWSWDNNASFSAPRSIDVMFRVDHSHEQTLCSGDTTPPSVQVTSPDGSTAIAPGAILVSADASDASGVTRVEFLIDGSTPTQAYDTVAPYSYSWNAPVGTHTLRARAYDACGNAKLSGTVTVTVNNPDPCPNDAQGPVVTLVSPHNGDTVQVGAVTLDGDAHDPSGIDWVTFLVDGAVADRDHTAPYSLSQTFSTLGTHTIQLRAFDRCGNSTYTPQISVTVSDIVAPCANDHTPPTASIIGPADGATVPRGQVTIALSATDNVGVFAAAFEIDGAVPADSVDLAAPYAYVFHTSQATHTLRAHVVDYCGNDSWTAPVTVNVFNQNPVARPDSATVVRGGSVTIAVLGNDSDPDGDPIRLANTAVIVAPTNGTTTQNANGTITYRPNAGFPAAGATGTDTFRYRIADSYGKVHSAVVTITVTP